VNIHVALVPVMGMVGEQKTKPIQQSVRILRANGLFPDIIVCRSSAPLHPEPRAKIAQFCQVQTENVLSCPDVSNLYRVPLSLVAQRMDYLILHRLSRLPKCTPTWTEWSQLADIADQLQNAPSRVRIAIVGKYTGLQDSYLSIIKAIEHASIAERVPIKIDWIESTDLEITPPQPPNIASRVGSFISPPPAPPKGPTPHESAMELLRHADGILVPGGFGDRGIEGMISAIHHARVKSVPFFGICLGMQVAVLEYARNVLQLSKANSEEFDADCEHNVVIFMPEISKFYMGGTMRLGKRTTYFVEKHLRQSQVQKLYGEHHAVAGLYGIKIELNDEKEVLSVDERHRHRYEVNPKYVQQLEDAGLRFVGMDEKKERMEVCELFEHPFYVGVQYHPEFQSRPQWPSPPFMGFVRRSDEHFKRRASEI
jgi:CTP synthase